MTILATIGTATDGMTATGATVDDQRSAIIAGIVTAAVDHGPIVGSDTLAAAVGEALNEIFTGILLTKIMEKIRTTIVIVNIIDIEAGTEITDREIEIEGIVISLISVITPLCRIAMILMTIMIVTATKNIFISRSQTT